MDVDMRDSTVESGYQYSDKSRNDVKVFKYTNETQNVVSWKNILKFGK